MSQLSWLFNVVGFVGTVAGLIGLFTKPDDRIIAGIVAAVGIIAYGVGVWLRDVFGKLDYDIIEAEVELTLQSPQFATFKKTYHARPKRRGLRTWVHRNIAADGEVENICWERKQFAPHEVKQVFSKHYEVHVHFDPPLPLFKSFRGTLSYDMVDSFLNPHEEGMEYLIDFPTKRAKIVIILPPGCAAISATAVRRLGGQTEEVEGLEKSNDGRRLVLELHKPPVASTYDISWKWQLSSAAQKRSRPPAPQQPAVVQVVRADETEPT